MERVTFSTYEAKARFSEILRQVKARGDRVVITKHGRPVAEIVPYEESFESGTQRLARLEAEGVLEVSRHPIEFLVPGTKCEGALERFYQDRR